MWCDVSSTNTFYWKGIHLLIFIFNSINNMRRDRRGRLIENNLLNQKSYFSKLEGDHTKYIRFFSSPISQFVTHFSILDI